MMGSRAMMWMELTLPEPQCKLILAIDLNQNQKQLFFAWYVDLTAAVRYLYGVRFNDHLILVP